MHPTQPPSRSNSLHRRLRSSECGRRCSGGRPFLPSRPRCRPLRSAPRLSVARQYSTSPPSTPETMIPFPSRLWEATQSVMTRSLWAYPWLRSPALSQVVIPAPKLLWTLTLKRCGHRRSRVGSRPPTPWRSQSHRSPRCRRPRSGCADAFPQFLSRARSWMPSDPLILAVAPPFSSRVPDLYPAAGERDRGMSGGDDQRGPFLSRRADHDGPIRRSLHTPQSDRAAELRPPIPA